jgi:uncharacterized SAM-binding protein YcdF (DUF218 family)
MITVKRLLVYALVIVVVVYGVGALLFLRRGDDPLPPKADAIVVLAGNTSRLPAALALARAGVAPVLVVSRDETGRDPARQRLCEDDEQRPFEVVCRQAVPFSTRGEARLVAGLASDRGWDSVVIVSSRYHLFRAERLFARCTDADLVMDGVTESMTTNAVAIPLEWAKLVLAETARRGC